MKILLCALNAKYIHSNPAIYILKACAGAGQEAVELAEYTINQLPDQILADIYGRQPDVIAFSCYIWNYRMVRDLLMELPKVLPSVPIWLGGPEVSYDAVKELEAFPQVTGIMVGEGENTFRDLVDAYLQGKSTREDLEQVAGLCIRKADGPGFTGIRPLTDLDTIPFFYENLEEFTHRILYYETSRGCPFGCSYCLSSLDRKLRFRSLDLVLPELQFFLDHRVPQVKFIDRTFNCSHAHARAIWQYLIDHDNGVTNFHFEIAADLLEAADLDLIRQMRPGLIQLEIGVQSTNMETIHEIRRRMDLDRVRANVYQIRQMENTHQHLDLIAGLPLEGYESFVRSFNDVYHMYPDQLQMGFLKVLKGSYMEERAGDYGLLSHSEPPYEVLATRWLGYDRILEFHRVEEMLEEYYNSGQFTRTMQVLEQAAPSPYALYLALADYYGQKGYQTNRPARSYRYEILLEFARQLDPGREDLYRELLTLDYYLKEPAKSRPSFARDLSAYKKDIYARERHKQDHIEVFYYPVWQIGRAGVGHLPELVQGNQPHYILFHYENRDALDHNAQMEEI